MRLPRFVLSALSVAASPGLARVPPLQLPAASPKATVTRKVGFTDVTYGLHRIPGEKEWTVILSTLLGQKKVDEAIRVFENNTKDQPPRWTRGTRSPRAGPLRETGRKPRPAAGGRSR